MSNNVLLSWCLGFVFFIITIGFMADMRYTLEDLSKTKTETTHTKEIVALQTFHNHTYVNTTIVEQRVIALPTKYDHTFIKCGRRSYEYQVWGQSMAQACPVKEDGRCHILVEPVNAKDVKVGDQVDVIGSDGKHVFHIVSYADGVGVIETFGNANVVVDKENRWDQVVARRCYE